MHTNSNNKIKTARRITLALVATSATVALAAPAVYGAAVPGTYRANLQVGPDNDNAANTFIQPPGVVAKQHMDNTDVLIGRGGGDLQIGNLGGDTLLGGPGSDIQIGGPENFQAPNSDVIVGGFGDDINIWAPGDGSDAFLGQEGYDTMIFAPFVKNPDGSLKLERRYHRLVPRVVADGAPQFTCDIVPVPKSQKLGFQFLVRFNVKGVPAVTVRQRDVERVFCPGAQVGTVQVAYLNTHQPKFHTIPLRAVGGLAGKILASTR